MEKVLVTGGSGFIALHCIDQLLEKGFMVRTTIRSESRKDEINKAMEKYPNLHQNLEFHICDLLEDKGWDAAVDGCDYVLHVASPFILEVPSDEDVLIKPAVDGTLRVLNACSKANVKKVVLTSSVAAVAYGHGKEKTLMNLIGQIQEMTQVLHLMQKVKRWLKRQLGSLSKNLMLIINLILLL